MGLWMAAALLGTGMCLCAGEFAPPAEGPVAFRRDKIPLDADTIIGMSKQLGNLALGLNLESAENRRGVAQILALAIALDPGNAKARNLLTSIQGGRKLPTADTGKLTRSIARLWRYAAWLQTPEAGSQGRALAACLMDMMAVADPQDPRAKEWKTNGEQGAWAGWIPPLSAYQESGIDETAETKPDPETSPELVVSEQPKLAAAEIHTLLWQPIKEGKTTRWVMSIAPLEMLATRIKKAAGSPPGGLVMGGSAKKSRALSRLNASLLTWLKNRHDPFPPEVRISITSPALKASLQTNRPQSIRAAAAVLANSALTGVEPQGIIIGNMGEDWAFNPSTDFWSQLRSLERGNGQRLALPSAAQNDLPSMLALENPGFFLEYEVLLSPDIDGLLEVTAKTQKGALAEATAKFQIIRERLGNQDVREYIANRFVRQRLAEILQDFPGHYSAKMLLIQAAGDRPTVVSRRVLAAELKRAIEPMEWLTPARYNNFTAEEIQKLGETYELCRSQVEALNRYADKSDAAMIERTLGLIVALKNLDRAARSRGKEWTITNKIRVASRTLNGHHIILIRSLDKVTEFSKSP